MIIRRAGPKLEMNAVGPRYCGTTRMTICNVNKGQFRRVEDAESYCQNAWPQWYRNRYRAVGLSEEQPSPSESSLLLWKLAQLQRSLPNKPLYLEALTKGSVDLLGIIIDRSVPRRWSSDGIDQGMRDGQPGLPYDLTARTMLSLACIGAGLVWQEEMSMLCERLPVVHLETMQQVEDVSRALRLAKHWTEHFGVLEECAVQQLLKLGMKDEDRRQNDDHVDNADDVNKAAYCANNLSYMGHMPYALCDELCGHVSKMSRPGLLSYAKALSRCLADASSGHVDKDDYLLSKVMRCCVGVVDYITCQEQDWVAVDRRHQYHRNASQLFPFLLTMDVCIPCEEHMTLQQRERFDTLLEFTRVLWGDLYTPNRHHVSSFQKEVLSVVRLSSASIPGLSHGCRIKLETVVMESISVDIALEDARIAIEVDGYSHFCRNDTQKSIGNGSWKKAVLSNMGWKLISVGQPSWDLLENNADAKVAHVSQLLLSTMYN